MARDDAVSPGESKGDNVTSSNFRLLSVQLQHLPSFRYRQQEQMGTKAKLWLVHGRTGQAVMLKFARAGSGEDWSEKVASHIASAMGIPCPRVELAFVEEPGPGPARHAVLCWSFLRSRSRESLIHGNELLLKADPSYESANTYRAREHTLAAVEDVLRSYSPPERVAQTVAAHDAFDAFVGYLMLDALIGNTDRHHENWGVTSTRMDSGPGYRLAPSYDHASSLGRELPDRKRAARLGKSGRGTLEEYAQKATSAFWDDGGSVKLSTVGALERAAQSRPDAFQAWLERLRAVSLLELQAYVDRVPEARLSRIGKDFARKILEYNYSRITSLGNQP